MSDLTELTIKDAARLLRLRSFSSAELVTAHVERIAKVVLPSGARVTSAMPAWRIRWWSAARISTSPKMVGAFRPASALRTAGTSVDFALTMAARSISSATIMSASV